MLDRPVYLIHEHVGMFKLTDVYDIIDPATQLKIGEAREEISQLSKFLRLFVHKQLMPTTVNVYEGADESSQRLVFSIHRGVTFLRSRVEVIDASGKMLGFFKSKMMSIGGAFYVCTPDDQQVAMVKGDWKGWNFRFLHGEQELGTVSKKWAGLGKELFTSADKYVIQINGEPSPTINTLLLAAGLAIDTVFKEKR